MKALTKLMCPKGQLSKTENMADFQPSLLGQPIEWHLVKRKRFALEGRRLNESAGLLELSHFRNCSKTSF